MQRFTLSMDNPIKKLFAGISPGDAVITILCFALSRAQLAENITPFGMAFFAASFSHTGWFYAMTATMLGAITVHSGVSCGIYLITTGLTAAVLGLCSPGKKTLPRALTVSLIFLFTGLMIQTAYRFNLYDFIVISFESFLCFIGVFAIASIVPALTNYKNRNFLSHGEIIGIAALASMTIVSMCTLPDFFGMKISSFAAIFIIMAISHKGDIMISSCTGIIMGLALAMGTEGSASLVGAYAVAGFCAGFFCRYKRLGILLGVTLANAVLTAFMNDSAYMLINPVEVLIAGLIFVTLPEKTMKIFTDFTQKAVNLGGILSCRAENRYSIREERLSNMADAFSKTADIFRKDCFLRQPGKHYTERLFDHIAEKNCFSCNSRFDCWQKDRAVTLACMTKMLKTATEKGCVKKENIPEPLKENCIKKEELLKSFNFVYDIYKTDKLWLKKMYESRKLMVNQMEGIADTLKKFAEEGCVTTDAEAGIRLCSALDSPAIQIKKADVLIKDDKLYKVLVYTKNEVRIEELVQILSDTLDTKLRLYKSHETEDGYCYELCAEPEYTVQYATVYACKEGEKLCGDGFVAISLPEEEILAISDGMGSGETAHIQSRDTLEMLKAFALAGFDNETSFEMINSSLLMRSYKDCFSTIDMMRIDLTQGKIRLSKIGAAPTYIKQGEKIQRIECCTLPVGILREVSAETTLVQADEHCMAVMMSDGISNTVIKTNDNWIENELKSLNTHNPAIVAEKILKKAIAKNGGKTEDDMTVAVAVIYKNEYKGKNYI